MKKTLIYLLIIISSFFDVVAAQNSKYRFPPDNNENLYFNNEKDINGNLRQFSISKSFIKDFVGYKDIFPSLDFNEVSYFTPQYSDKNYSINWIVIDSLIYLAKVEGISDINNNRLHILKTNKVIENMTKRKFNTSYKVDELSQNIVEPNILFADWINGDYYIQTQDSKSWNPKDAVVFKIVIKNGKIIEKKKK
ncbi:MAG: hypothetical protein Q4G05_06840 [Clostridia bacterium]|nr:hypothetical protein [Clostridia bacterium]